MKSQGLSSFAEALTRAVIQGKNAANDVVQKISIAQEKIERTLIEEQTFRELPRYNVQCFAGHCYELEPGTILYDRAALRAERGYLDALPVPYKECEVCQENKHV